jgi:hypothetical protein
MSGGRGIKIWTHRSLNRNPQSKNSAIGVQISFDAANDALSIILNSSVPVSIGARCRRCSQRQVKMLLEPSDSWAEGVAVSI